MCKARYLEKLQAIDNKDPYEMDGWSAEMATWPEVSYPDIVNYLVYTQSMYTLAELKAYKSLEAYNYFVSGWVLDIGHVEVNNRSVLIGKVKHSQRMNDASLRPWIIAEKDGCIVSGHCTCMAGIGEVCSHVGALLFAVEAAVKIRNTKTVTEEKAYWLLPSAVPKIAYKTVQDIDFTSAKTKKKQLDTAIATSTPVPAMKQKKLPDISGPTPEELNHLFSTLKDTGNKPALLSLIPGYAQDYRPKALDKKYPKVLSELYDEHISQEEISDHCENVFLHLNVSEDEARNCELDTRTQSKCKQWFSFRTGRITASRMKAVCATSIEKPSKSLVKNICYPTSKPFTAKQTQWGCDHEKDAKELYIKTMMHEHENFTLSESGFVINPKYPFMGATPDGVGSCDCCGEVLLEIKCPYCRRAADVDDNVDCLEQRNDKLSLKLSHAYYYQVQCQLLLTNKEFCDFVVWTEKAFFMERIAFDESFCEKMVDRATQFFKKVLLPELIGKVHSQLQPANVLQEQPVHTNVSVNNDSTSNAPATSDDDELVICVCRQIYRKTDNVIGCDNKNCPYGWLHFKCAGIKRIPKGNWFCKACRKHITMPKKKVRCT